MGEAQLREVRRKFGMVFQGAALFDSMTVFQNVSFPLREHRKDLKESELRQISRTSWPWSACTTSRSGSRRALGRNAQARRARPGDRARPEDCPLMMSRRPGWIPSRPIMWMR